MIDVFERVQGPGARRRAGARNRRSRRYGIVDDRRVARATASTASRTWSRSRRARRRRRTWPSSAATSSRPTSSPRSRPRRRDRTGEIQLTNGLRRLLQDRPIYACEVKGVRHDTGNKLGFLKAVVYFALRRPGPGGGVPEYLRDRSATVTTIAATALGARGRQALGAAASDELAAAAAVGYFLSRMARRRCEVGAASTMRRSRSWRRFSRGVLEPRSRASPLSVSAVGLVRLRRRPALPRVVGDVPAGALELDGRRRQQPAAPSRRTSGTCPPSGRRTSGSPRSGAPHASHSYS